MGPFVWDIVHIVLGDPYTGQGVVQDNSPADQDTVLADQDKGQADQGNADPVDLDTALVAVDSLLAD